MFLLVFVQLVLHAIMSFLRCLRRCFLVSKRERVTVVSADQFGPTQGMLLSEFVDNFVGIDGAVAVGEYIGLVESLECKAILDRALW